MKRIIVCGSRDWSDRTRVVTVIGELERRHQVEGCVIVHGCAAGADAMAAQHCATLGIATEEHPADWRTHGSAAGPIRNSKMAELGADECIAFWDGKSRGTLDMIQKAVRHGIQVRVIAPRSGE